MSLNVSLPGARQPVIEAGDTAARPYYVFFQSIATTLQSLSDQIDNVTTTPTESPISENANVVGKYSIYTRGILKTGIVSVLLIGDVETPGKTQYYGSDATGEKGWFNVSDALDSTANITLTVGTDGITTLDLSAGVLASLTLADSSVQPGDNVSVLTNDAGYVDAAGAADAAPVQSVNGATGTVVLTAADVGAATTAQGSKADSALQSVVAGTNVTVDDTDPQNPVINVASGAGSGDVVGPASSVDSDVALFDGTTGKLLKDGGSFGGLVRAAVLTGLSTATSAIIAATDTVLGALGKLQAQITDNLLPKGYIDGLPMAWVSGSAVTIKSGACYIPGVGKVVRNDSDMALTGIALGASAWGHLYVYSNAGVLAGEVSTTAPDVPYNGTARCKTGDTSRRYVGSIKTDASGNLFSFIHSGNLVSYREDVANGIFRLVSAGTPTTETSVSASAAIPLTARIGLINFINTATSGGVIRSGTSDDNFSAPGVHGIAYARPQGASLITHPLDSSQAFTYWFDAAPSGGSAFINALGYLYER